MPKEPEGAPEEHARDHARSAPGGPPRAADRERRLRGPPGYSAFSTGALCSAAAGGWKSGTC